MRIRAGSPDAQFSGRESRQPDGGRPPGQGVRPSSVTSAAGRAGRGSVVDAAVQPASLVVDTGSEEQLVDGLAIGSIAEGDAPEAWNRHRRAASLRQAAHGGAGARVESVDRSVAKVADQQRATHGSKAGGGRQRDAPRSIEHAAGYQMRDQITLDVEHGQVAKAGTYCLLVRRGIDLGVGDINLRGARAARNILDAERRVTGRDRRIDEATGAYDRRKGAI